MFQIVAAPESNSLLSLSLCILLDQGRSGYLNQQLIRGLFGRLIGWRQIIQHFAPPSNYPTVPSSSYHHHHIRHHIHHYHHHRPTVLIQKPGDLTRARRKFDTLFFQHPRKMSSHWNLTFTEKKVFPKRNQKVIYLCRTFQGNITAKTTQSEKNFGFVVDYKRNRSKATL